MTDALRPATATVLNDARRANGLAPYPTVELRGVTKVYRGMHGTADHLAVNDVSLRIMPGEVVCVLGPSGHGKSTMLNMLAGFVAPTQGEVVHDGELVTGPHPRRGVVFQRDTLFPWMRVEDNLTYGLRSQGVPRAQRREIAAQLLEAIDLAGYGRSYPDQLSGGMRRRVAIAAVLANKPSLMLMDEPFTGLDYVRRMRLYRMLETMRAQVGATIFCVTHDVDEALLLADRILIVLNGRIEADFAVEGARPRNPDFLAAPDAMALRGQVLAALNRALGAGGDE